MFKRGHDYPGLWLCLEGGEGSGKDTQIKLLKESLQNKGYIVNVGREPGHTIVGKKIREILQNPDIKEIDVKTETLLYIAAGIEFFKQSVKPVLEKGEIFLANRGRWSTKAYQSYGNGIDMKAIDHLIDFSTDGSLPDLTYIIDIEARRGLGMLTSGEFEGHTKDKIEARGLEYHERVNQGYREIAEENRQSCKIIPYIPGNKEKMQSQIRTLTQNFISHYNLEDKLARA